MSPDRVVPREEGRRGSRHRARRTRPGSPAWLAPDELDTIDWLEPDRPFLPELRFALEHAATLARGGSSTRRVIVFDEDDARAVEQRLRDDGFDAEVVRERLQGEDDDEDHPWAVLTDAPSLVADVLADEFDGWLDEEPEQPAPRVGSPLDLPTAPRRIKRTDA